MKILKGQIKEDFHKDIFWQRSHVKNDEGNLICKIIICASQEALSYELKQRMVDMTLKNPDLQVWFNKKTEEEFESFKKSNDPNKSDVVVIVDITPQIESLFDFANNL